MTVRCPECSTTLRVKQERIGNRTHGTCPSCRASVPLKASEERIQVQCTQCNTMLKAPASSAGMQGRCPKCRAAIAIGRPAFQETHAETHAHDAESSVSTQRISVRALGIDTMALSASIAEAAAGAGKSTAHHATTAKGSATSLLESPPPALTTAAEGIKAAARGIASTPTQPAHHAPTSAKKSETPAATPGRTLAQILEQRERAHDEQFASAPSVKAFSTLQGILCGATAGAIVGTLWAVLRSRIDTQVIETFLAPPPAFASGFGLSAGIVGIAMAIVLGAAIGLVMSWTEPPRSEARPGPRFVRCVAFGLGIGLLMAALWFFNSGNPINVGGLTPAFNWVRDMMVTGILTGALLHLFTPSKA